MSERIKPALTPEEWRAVQTGYGCYQDPPEDWSLGGGIDEATAAIAAAQEDRWHRAAALCMESARKMGEPFGFTREDVRRHREAVTNLNASLSLRAIGSLLQAPEADPFAASTERIRRKRDWHRSMADRLESLLAPEGR